MYDQIVSKNSKIGVVGLGYVGLPIALALSKKAAVIGFDINPDRIALMQQGIDPSREIPKEGFENSDIKFTSDIEDLRQASFYIIAVPTPVDSHNVPNLDPIRHASHTVGKVLKPGDYIVYESTVYPGCTEEDCVPILEEVSGLRMGDDFKVGYSPERINPGDKEHTLSNVIKVVSGSDEIALDNIAKVYELVVTAGVHRASSIKVAEASKIIENTQRDLNIALMNELSIIFDRIGINTYEVIEAAGTKWNFLKFFPGLVGGHCIGVDPYYLTYKSEQLGYKSRVIQAGRIINDEMPQYIAKKTVQHILNHHKEPSTARVLIKGISFKENVSDIRNSKVANLIDELKNFAIYTELIDPVASASEVAHEYGIEMIDKETGKYDVIILAVNHNQYKNLSEEYFRESLTGQGLIIDIKGNYRHLSHQFNYFSL